MELTALCMCVCVCEWNNWEKNQILQNDLTRSTLCAMIILNDVFVYFAKSDYIIYYSNWDFFFKVKGVDIYIYAWKNHKPALFCGN